jgi:DNA mismatch repair protein MutS2
LRDQPTLDLLDPAPRGFDRAAARRALDFAWATGAGLDELARALEPAPATASTFEPSAFAGDLFLADLVRRCFPLRAQGARHAPDMARLAAVVGRPPSDPAVVAHRRTILAELADSAPIRAATEALWVRIRELRERLGATGGVRDRAAERMRRLDVLVALRDALQATDALDDAVSPLREIASFGAEVRESAAFARLSELLDWESGASTVELSIRVGADGTIRGVTALARRERPPPVGESTWRRILRRLLRVLRGERWDEEEAVARLVDEVFAPLADAVMVLLRVGLDLEPYLGSLGLRDLADGAGLSMSLPAIAGRPDGSPAVRLEGLWNPFLLVESLAASGAAPVACDLVLEDGPPLAVITGPNSGGKTRLLQSVALAVLLGQGGFFVPAASAAWPWVPSLFASIVQAAEHDAPEGRLGTELLRVRDVFEHARPGCLVVLDELCAGTNPSEAEELVRFVVEQLAALGAVVVVTTHLLDVARRLEREPPAPRLAFRQVELAEGERPTFRFTPGVAPSSLARRTAERLGVTREALAELVATRLEDAVEAEVPEALSTRAPPSSAARDPK